jgi:eukaryotic-like serine/threonine-protein kinase
MAEDPDAGRLAKGTVLASRYELDGLLGHGGMADVYHGIDQVLGRQVAVKVLGPQFARDQSFVARFRREAQAAAALNHPNLVSVFDTGSDDGTHYIVMEYVAGTTLAKVIRDEGPLPADRAAAIALAVARALAFAHRAGLVHRDVKPANIMLSGDGTVKVMDFGIARTTNGESLTQTAAVLGTATYFSPEQAQGAAVDARSDIYALGCVLFEMLTGHPPFAGENPVAVAYKHVTENPPRPSEEAQGVPAELEAIVMRCLAKHPDDRYQTAEDLADDLQRFRTGSPVDATALLAARPTQALPTTKARPLPPTPKQQDDRRRRRIGVAAIVTALVVIVGLGLFLLARSLGSSGSQEITVDPSVVGKTVTVAKEILASQGFTNVTTTTQPNQAPAGIVTDYNPKTAVPGDAITLTVSSGPAQVGVPNVVCETRRDAFAQLKAVGLTALVGQPPVNNPICPTKGVVAAQDPPGGTTVNTGTSVTLWFVPAPSPSPSPSPPPSPSLSPSPPPSPSPSPTAESSPSPS